MPAAPSFEPSTPFVLGGRLRWSWSGVDAFGRIAAEQGPPPEHGVATDPNRLPGQVTGTDEAVKAFATAPVVTLVSSAWHAGDDGVWHRPHTM